jgi:hypothetical protein
MMICEEQQQQQQQRMQESVNEVADQSRILCTDEY